LRARYLDDGHKVSDWAPDERKFFAPVPL